MAVIKNKVEVNIDRMIKEIQDKQDKILYLEQSIEDLKARVIARKILPLKIGGYAQVFISLGKSKKWSKCLLELSNGELYARPLKKDGVLSAMHFYVGSYTSSDMLEKLKEV